MKKIKNNLRLKAAMLMVFVVPFMSTRADEGMWLPFLIQQYNLQDMVRLGCRLSAEDIYAINQASLKDAIVMLDGGGCTGEMISADGLFLTNHHCGYDNVRYHSTVDKDYTIQGFWAKTRKDELPNPGKTATFLVRMADVTDQVLDSVTSLTGEKEREMLVSNAIRRILEGMEEEEGLMATIESMFEGNGYYLFVYETFTDVRLVGAPPKSIGNFGGDTDNWMWPRHTGDFTLFRVYTGPDGKPAEYHENNIPYKPRHFLKISLKGYQENDFAMIMGYPGSTDRHLPSDGVALRISQINPATVKLRASKMAILKEVMDADDAMRIMYTSKFEYLGNFWKKDLEEMKALQRLKVFDKKRTMEDAFADWAQADSKRSKVYGDVIRDIRAVYAAREKNKYHLARTYFVETLVDANLMLLAYRTNGLYWMLAEGKASEEAINEMRETARELYAEYNPQIDQKILAAMLKAWYEDLPQAMHLDIMNTVQKKYKGDFERYTRAVYAKSVFATPERFQAFLNNPSAKILDKDPGFEAMRSVGIFWQRYRQAEEENTVRLERARRLYLAGIQEMYPDRKFYPDANSTMRLTYGSVKPYHPRDAVYYHYQTFLEGVIEKENPDSEEFIVPAKLMELFKAKDYGEYADNGRMPVCFLTTNDITGGNSGSPVLNADGHLIGTAFDGNSDAMSSDVEFDPVLQRTIVCDIRYVLFVIDKFAGAKHLIDEMVLVR